MFAALTLCYEDDSLSLVKRLRFAPPNWTLRGMRSLSVRRSLSLLLPHACGSKDSRASMPARAQLSREKVGLLNRGGGGYAPQRVIAVGGINMVPTYIYDSKNTHRREKRPAVSQRCLRGALAPMERGRG